MDRNEKRVSKTVGQEYTELTQNVHIHDDHTVADRIKQGEPDYADILERTLLDGKKKFPGNFFIEMCVKSEKLFSLMNPRWIPHARQSCPTPMPNQTVYHYNKQDDYLEYLWTIPDIHSCAWIIENALNLPEDQKELRDFVFDFKDGKLFRLCLELNGELEAKKIVIAKS